MSGRPVRLLTAAALAAAASLASITAASANCYSCGPSVAYAAPVVTYQAPVVYSYSYAQPVTYASAGCGCIAQRPMYVVNQGPTYNEPVTIEAEPTPAPYYGRAYPYYSEGGVRWHRRHWHRGYGYRGHGYRHHGYRHHGYRYGAVGPDYRYGRPMVGPRGIYRGSRFAHVPRVRFDLPYRGHRMHMGPGMVHPRMMGPGPRGPMHGPMGPKKKWP